MPPTCYFFYCTGPLKLASVMELLPEVELRGSKEGGAAMVRVPLPLTLALPVTQTTPVMLKPPDWFQLPLV